MMNAVGVLGGTFDPVHRGHTSIALDIADKCALQGVRFIPNARSPLRDFAHASNLDRLAMLELALAVDVRFSIDRRELESAPPSYTVDTLQSLRNELQGMALCFILGMDAFVQFRQWHRWQDITSLAHLVVARRPDCEMHFNDEELMALFNRCKTENINDLHNKAHGHIYVCDVQQVDVSATQIRARVIAGESLEGLVAEPVAHYIQQHGLYK
jgi:nicotinate-nucleotide adenylyltransferase